MGSMKTTIGIKQIIIGMAVISLLAAFVIGRLPKSTSIESYLPDTSDTVCAYDLAKFEAPSNYLFESLDTAGNTVGYITLTEGRGYGGILLVEIVWSLDGAILSITVPEQQ
ncbi:transcriptional regulator, partial [Dehalococcoides mccartyi]